MVLLVWKAACSLEHLVARMGSGVLEVSSFTPFANMRLSITIKWKAGLGRAREAKILLTFKASLCFSLERVCLLSSLGS